MISDSGAGYFDCSTPFGPFKPMAALHLVTLLSFFIITQ